MPKLGEVRGKAVLAVLNGKLGGRYGNWGLAQFSGWKDKSSDYVQDEYDVPTLFDIAKKQDHVRTIAPFRIHNMSYSLLTRPSNRFVASSTRLAPATRTKSTSTFAAAPALVLIHITSLWGHQASLE